MQEMHLTAILSPLPKKGSSENSTGALWPSFPCKELIGAHSCPTVSGNLAERWVTGWQRKVQDPVPGSGRPGEPVACRGEQLQWPDPGNSSGALLPGEKWREEQLHASLQITKMQGTETRSV